MSKKTNGRWSQGKFLVTANTSTWSPEQKEAARKLEERMVFSNFSAVDDGLSRTQVATCLIPEDARRIVACVNACEGLDTELLETSQQQGGAILFLQSQRNEILCALRGLVLFTNPKPSNALALHNAHQAIASVTTEGSFTRHPAVAQRDELLAALEMIKHATAPTHEDGAFHENAYSLADAAIASVKGNPQ